MESSKMSIFVIPYGTEQNESFAQAITKRSKLKTKSGGCPWIFLSKTLLFLGHPKLVSKREFKELEQEYGKIENSFIECDEQVEKWWDSVKSQEVVPRTKVVQGNSYNLIFIDIF